ncbi:MAG: hypothetical protein AUH86_04940 [Acidobacteria bacterium 13_1_40CM_4_58_4]|nr:MAG: hypothetical protein AUH86_04940 [Acidobacteria bacterium 13_1_40CM_4_58_4]OLE57882.1 MAG: hypothetical protein AUG13_01745 [Chloroflexi bacterium 13_1_20CM_2_59_7]HLB89366.1 hypothetical protein [Terriglobales bacterium]
MGHGERAWVLVSLLVLCAAACAQGQKPEDAVDGPSQHHFWDRTNKALFSVHAGLEAADFGITHHNLSQGGTELNPMAKALCESGTAGQVVFFGGRTVSVLGISYFLHKTGHHKLERAFSVLASGDSAYGVTYSFAHR